MEMSNESEVRMLEASNSTCSLRIMELSQPKRRVAPRYKEDFSKTINDNIQITDEFSPSPNTYHTDMRIFGATQAHSKIRNSPSFAMSRAGSVNHNKVIISSLHKADLLGVNSPGVGQYDTMQSSFKTGYSISKANRWKSNLKNR